MESFVVGDKIEPNDLPGLILAVLDVTQCPYRDERPAYVVENGIGAKYTLCAYEVHRASIRERSMLILSVIKPTILSLRKSA